MSIQLSIDGFEQTLQEVEILIEMAKECENNNQIKYGAINKSAFLLLASKFENFIERILEDYIDSICQLNLPCTQLPEILLIQHTFQLLNKIESYNAPHKHHKAKDVFKDVGQLWVTENNISRLDIKCKFSYGKHGEKEFQKLFNIIGFNDIFSEIEITDREESLYDDISEQIIVVDFKGKINSLTNLRNNILHQDASPNLDVNMIEQYKKYIGQFAQKLITLLNTKIIDLHSNC